MDRPVFIDIELDFAAEELCAQLTGLSSPRQLTFKFKETTFNKADILDLLVSQLSILTLSTSQTSKTTPLTNYLIPVLMKSSEYNDHLRLFEVFTSEQRQTEEQ